MSDTRPALTPRETPLAPGDQAPRFTLPAIRADGSQFDADLAELLAAGPVMLVFYQDDGMPVCTSELKAFAQEHALLAEAGVQVLAINTNGLGSHRRFQERDHYPFPLISDFYGEVVKAYGMWDPDEAKSRRGVVILDRDGHVTYALPHFNPGSVSTFEEIFRALGLA
ncbi:MAG: peroxiredoxin family protein [Chloroflexi bacterium]|nr:redoxin domain-containing protein [Dehalococcoidia bacterium]MCO5203192.1 peroxiredoxin family protein [Chloroflexota bacterium]MCZ7576364.1 peroxiredoxin family protein [Dehalococcoidia bacterium]